MDDPIASPLAQPPYFSLAQVYDRVMSHVSYDRWRRYILEIEAKVHLPSLDVLELGAGTGKLAELFEGNRWRWHASDRSLPMLCEAKKRLANFSRLLLVQDARFLSLKKKFGLAVFLYDGINYLMDQQELRQSVLEVKEALLPGGYFLFDVTTEANSLRHFADFTHSEEYGQYRVTRHSYYDRTERIQHNDFTLLVRPAQGSFSQYHEAHVQRVYSLDEIHDTLKEADLKLTGMWNGYGFCEATRDSERVHFLAKKEG